VITEKFGERISTHCVSPAKLWRDHRTTQVSPKQILRKRMAGCPQEAEIVPHNATEANNYFQKGNCRDRISRRVVW
jgi:hypothetical protein